jgi:FimV-like protein
MNPRNANYRLNLAQMYLNNRQPDKAIAILQALQNSGDEGVAQRAAVLLAQAQEFQASMEATHAFAVAPGSPEDAPMNGPARIQKASTPDEAVTPSSGAPVKFLKGTEVSVDCSAAPSATLTVVSGTRRWQMRVPDTKHALVVGADEFSCEWKKQKVALNYRESGDAAGSVISIEVQ